MIKTYFNVNPSHEGLTEVHFEPTDKWSKLLFLISGQFGHFIFAGLKLLSIVDEFPDHKLVFSGLKLDNDMTIGTLVFVLDLNLTKIQIFVQKLSFSRVFYPKIF